MVSNTEIRRRNERSRQKKRSTAAKVAGVAVAIVIGFIPSHSRWGMGLGLAIAAACLIYGLLQSNWIVDADLPIKKWTRFALASIACIALFAIYGRLNWPPVRRHSLSQAEREAFEKPLKNVRQPKQSIHLFCGPNDEIDCDYAGDLIPLFGEAGWDVSTTVERISLGRPKSGVLIGLHGSVKPEDEAKLKWNQGEWSSITAEVWAVRKAFANIGIEPDSTAGATVPENQINIYVGHERDNESAPTDMTRTFEGIEQSARQNPEQRKSLGMQ